MAGPAMPAMQKWAQKNRHGMAWLAHGWGTSEDARSQRSDDRRNPHMAKGRGLLGTTMVSSYTSSRPRAPQKRSLDPTKAEMISLLVSGPR